MPVPSARAVLFLKLRIGTFPGSIDLPSPPRASISDCGYVAFVMFGRQRLVGGLYALLAVVRRP